MNASHDPSCFVAWIKTTPKRTKGQKMFEKSTQKRNLKTDKDYINEIDYIQRNQVLQELTVTITLHEYRELVTVKAQNSALNIEVWTLKREKEKIEEENAELKHKLDVYEMPIKHAIMEE